MEAELLAGDVVSISLFEYLCCMKHPCPGMTGAPLLYILAVPGNGGPWSSRARSPSVPQRLVVARVECGLTSLTDIPDMGR